MAKTKLSVPVVVLLVASAAAAPAQDFTGTWTLEAQYDTAANDAIVTCLYTGEATITGTSGPATLTLAGTQPVVENHNCEPSMTGTVTVTSGRNGGILGTITGQLGTADFSGQLVTRAAPVAGAKAATTYSGSVTPTSGALLGASGGAFTAALAPMAPALPPAALGLLLFLLVAVGGWLIVRRRGAGSAA